MLKVRKKDTVMVRVGKDKGKKGEVLKVYNKEQRALVSKVNIMKKHARPTQQNPGGVVEKGASIHISNLQVVCPKCSQPTKIKFDSLEDGEKVRVCKKCGEMII